MSCIMKCWGRQNNDSSDEERGVWACRKCGKKLGKNPSHETMVNHRKTHSEDPPESFQERQERLERNKKLMNLVLGEVTRLALEDSLAESTPDSGIKHEKTNPEVGSNIANEKTFGVRLRCQECGLILASMLAAKEHSESHKAKNAGKPVMIDAAVQTDQDTDV